MATALVTSYLAPSAPTGGLAVTVVDAATGKVWSPAGKGFVPATGPTPPTDTLLPLTLVGGPNHPLTYVGTAPNVPAPIVAGGTLVYVHPAGGGPPSDPNPMAVHPDAVTTPKGMSFALIVQGP